mgnify:CR=1 FL=1
MLRRAGFKADTGLTLTPEEQQRVEAAIRDEFIRLRPVLMTTACTILAMLPMALGLGEGSELQAPMARVVVGGLPNKLVADQLDISVRTVEVHRARVFDKMGVKSAVELANLMRNA